MKTPRKPDRLMALLLVGMSSFSWAADLVVEENGVAPNFSSIQAAVTAASPGDRIFVKNKGALVPYQESVTIDKPIELLPFTSDGQFFVLGNYTITPNAGNFSASKDTVRIIGMANQNGSITASTNNTSGNPVRLELMGNELTGGSITITGTDIVSRIAGNWIKSGSISTREADIIGNLVAGEIVVFDVANPSDPARDTLYIVGNRLATDSGEASFGSITWNNDGHYLYLANNWVRSGDVDGLIRINVLKTGTTANQIVNNSVEGLSGSNNDGIFIAWPIPAGVVLLIENNLLHNEGGSSTERGIRFVNASPSSTVLMNYNVHEGWTELSNAPVEVSQTGNVQAPSTMNPDNVTGVCPTSACVNVGNPDPKYTDHDLSRNDVGVGGGSYRFTNFWPILSGGARVYFLRTPSTVSQGNPLTAEGEAFDR